MYKGPCSLEGNYRQLARRLENPTASTQQMLADSFETKWFALLGDVESFSCCSRDYGNAQTDDG